MARCELFGVIFIVLLGSALHFTYEASGQFWLVGVFSAMNESVWEHLKLAYWPGLIWTGLLVASGQQRVRNFWIGRASALIIPSVVITLGYYAYTAALGYHALTIDLALFVIAVFFGQLSAMVLYGANRLKRRYRTLGLVLTLSSGMAFSVISFFPPDWPLFVDLSAH